MGERAHALLGPSAAHRWLNCTASPLIEAALPDEGSAYAEEGTCAHALCAKNLKEMLGLDTAAEDAELAELWPRWGCGEMEEHCGEYAVAVMEIYEAAKARTPDARLIVEERLDLSDYAPESFGTSDAVIIADGDMEVIDFKYGKGVKVEAEGNAQMRLYALGALSAFDYAYDIRRVGMTIIQPRLGHVSTARMGADALRLWGDEVVKPKAREAMEGGAAKPGDWCRFCKARGECRALASLRVAEAGDMRPVALMSAEEMAALLPKLDAMCQWCGDVADRALALAVAGERLPGYKVVEGRSVRKIADTALASARLREAGYDPADFMREPQLKTLGELETLVGKSRLAKALGDAISKPAGKPTLAPESDKREPWSSAAAIFSDTNQ